MSPLLLASLTLAFVAAAFCGTAVRAIDVAPWHEIEDYCRLRKSPERFSQIYDLHESVHQVAETLQQVFSAAWLVGMVLLLDSRWAGGEVESSSGVSLMSLFLLAIFGLVVSNSWVPRAVAHVRSVEFLYHSWGWWRALTFLAQPLMAGSNVFTFLIARASGRPEEEVDEEEAFEEEIMSMVSEAEQDGYIESEARDMIEGVIELGDSEVRSVMTPRSRVEALPVQTTWEDMVTRVVESGRTRIPIYRDQIDDVIGILYAKDLLRESLRSESKRRSLTRLMRKPLFVPEATRLDEMLSQFLHQRTHLAIVQNEYGGLSGVVTIEDVLEEIVGEIVDETDKEKSSEINILNQDQADVMGHAHIDKLNEQLGLALPEEDKYDTVSGLIMSYINEIPRPGHELVIGKVQFNIQEANRRQILSVRVTRLPDSEDG